MANEEVTADELYELILDRLREHKAVTLIEDIERSISRGKVDSPVNESSKVFRQLTAEEKLSIALEHVVATLDIPTMLARSKEIMNCDQIVWEYESNSGIADRIANEPFTASLRKLVAVLDELQLPSPELT